MTRILLLILALTVGSFFHSPVLAQQGAEEEEPGELAREGLERMMKALELFIDMIPQYEVPELTDDGDIIIRRKQDDDNEAPKADDEIDQTRT